MEVKFVKVPADKREAFEIMKQERVEELKKVEIYLDFKTGKLYCVEPADSLAFGGEDLGYVF